MHMGACSVGRKGPNQCLLKGCCHVESNFIYRSYVNIFLWNKLKLTMPIGCLKATLFIGKHFQNTNIIFHVNINYLRTKIQKKICCQNGVLNRGPLASLQKSKIQCSNHCSTKLTHASGSSTGLHISRALIFCIACAMLSRKWTSVCVKK